MKIGHINLARSFNGTGEHFVALIEALSRQGVEQHIIARNRSLAKRVAVYDHVTIGPLTSSPVVAYCLMPQVNVAHMHDRKSAQSGLLLTLTRSIPFVLTYRNIAAPVNHPIARSIHQRAASHICNNDSAANAVLSCTPAAQVDIVTDITRRRGEDFAMLGNRAAAEHLRIYRRAADSWHVPALLL